MWGQLSSPWAGRQPLGVLTTCPPEAGAEEPPGWRSRALGIDVRSGETACFPDLEVEGQLLEPVPG